MATFFINNINSHLGYTLIEELRNDDIVEKNPNVFYGTQDPKNQDPCPPGVSKILNRNKPKTFLRNLLECDVIIYDLFSADLEEVEDKLKSLKGSTFNTNKTVVLISSVTVWGDTPPKKIEIPITEEEQSTNIEESRRVLTPENAKENQSDEGIIEENDEEKKEEKKEEGEESKEEDTKENEEKNEVKNKDIEPEIKKKYKILPFEEADYQLRKAYPRYESWKRLENFVLAMNDKENIRAYVICSGIIYGQGEGVLAEHFLSAWLGEPDAIPYMPPGDNLVPTIHIVDLARSIKHVIERVPINLYILAIDKTQNRSQKNIIEAISNGIGNGKTVTMDYKEAAFEEWGESLTIDLWMKPSPTLGFNDEGYPLPFSWHCLEGIPDSMLLLNEEFNEYRGLSALKIFITGPPASGKSHHGKKIAEFYNIPYINVGILVQEILSSQSELGEIVRNKLADLKKHMIEEAEAKKKKNQELDYSKFNPRIPDDLLVEVFKWKLQSNLCRNRGFLLDGWPRKYDDAKRLFLQGTELNMKIYPQSVIVLKGANDVLIQRVKQLPEQATLGTHFTDEGMKRRLAAYRESNNNDKGNVTVQDFFTQHKSENLDIDCLMEENAAFEHIKNYIDKNRKVTNISLAETEEEIEKNFFQPSANLLSDPEASKSMPNVEKANKPDVEALLFVEQMKAREKELLEARSQPLRYYLMEHVIQHVTEGLFEICRTLPEDPVGYLAQFLYKKNEEFSKGT